MLRSPLSSRTTRGAAAGLLGAAAALAAVTGTGPVPSIFQLTGASEDVSGPCDEAEHAADPACAGALRATDQDSSTTSSTDDSTTTSGLVTGALSEVRTVHAGDAGSVMVAVEGASLRLLTAVPNTGWQVEVEHAAGQEVEVTFRSGSVRVDVNVELEDGQVRERVRTRDEATDTETRVEDGVVVRDDDADDLDDLDDDRSGSNSGSDSNADDADDDSSGPGSGSSDDGSHDDDEDSSGSGSDDGPDHD